MPYFSVHAVIPTQVEVFVEKAKCFGISSLKYRWYTEAKDSHEIFFYEMDFIC